MKKRYKFWIGLLISSLFFLLFIRGMDLKEMWEATKDANYFYIFLAAIINTFSFFIRAERWDYLLEPIKKVRLGSLFSAVCIGFMGNSILPARAGEFIRAYVIGKREGISKTSSFATIVLERLFDGFTLLIMLIFIVSLFPFPRDNYSTYITTGRLYGAVIFTSLFYGLAISMVILMSWKPKNVWEIMHITLFRFFPKTFVSKIEELYKSFLLGFDSLKKGRHIFSISVYSVILWFVTAFGLYLLFPAFSIQFNYFAAILVMVVVAVVIMLPSSPGYVGTFHLASSETLILLGVNVNKAKSFAILHHACCIVPVTILGLFYLSRVNLTFKEIKITVDKEMEREENAPECLDKKDGVFD